MQTSNRAGGEADDRAENRPLLASPLGTAYEQSYPGVVSEEKQAKRKAKRRASGRLASFARELASHEAWHCACGGWGVWRKDWPAGTRNPKVKTLRGGYGRLVKLGAVVYDNGKKLGPEPRLGAVVCARPQCGQVIDYVRLRREGKCRSRPIAGAHVRLIGQAVRAGPGCAVRRTLKTNLHRCSSGWRCPTCARIAQAEAAEHLQAANLGYRRDNPKGAVYLMTNTIPHHPGSAFAELRRIVTRAYQRTQQGSKATLGAMRERFGVEASVRALEVKFGPSGPHPHVHTLVFCRAALTDKGRAALLAWNSARWVRAVTEAGWLDEHDTRREAFERYGVHLSEADRQGAYLAKMGLTDELAGDTTKGEAHCPHCQRRVSYVWSDGRRCEACGTELGRTPLQILSDYHEHGRKADGALWMTYFRGIGGARRLTWSRWGLKLREAYPRAERTIGQRVTTIDVHVHRDHWTAAGPDRRADAEAAARDGDQAALALALPEAFAVLAPFAADDPEPVHVDDCGKLTKAELRELVEANA